MPNKISVKGFLTKLTKPNVSAAAFLAAHREYMETGELAAICLPVLAKVDVGELMPTPAIHVIASAVMNHIIAFDLQKLNDKLENPPQEAKSKTWTATVYNANNVIETRLTDKGELEELVKGFNNAAQADRWADKSLFDGADGWYAIVEGYGTMVKVERSDAMARILKAKRGPLVHQKSQTTASLSFGMKVSQDRVSFSRG